MKSIKALGAYTVRITSSRYPDGSPSHPSIYINLMMLLAKAEKSIKIASSYWSLRNVDVDDQGTNTSWQGENVFKGIYEAGKKRNISVKIAQDKPSRYQPDDDTKLLVQGKDRREVFHINLQLRLSEVDMSPYSVSYCNS